MAATGARTAPETSDSEMFRTTSIPVKPAALVFQPEPEPQPKPKSAAPGVRRVTAAGLRVPLGPTGEPDIRARLMVDPSPREAQDAGTTRGIRLPPMARRETPAAARLAAQRAEPLGRNQRRPATPAVGVPPSGGKDRLKPELQQSVGTPRPGKGRHVILRVRIAELNRSAARRSPIMDLSFRNPELLEPLLKAGSGKGAIVLENLDFDQIEWQLRALQQRDIVWIRSRPTLVTASGRPTKFVAGGGPRRPILGSGIQTSTATGDFPAEVTVRPVAIDEDRILLEVICNASGSNPPSSVSANATWSTLPEKTKVEMRAGQTVAIGGLKLEPREDKPEEQGNSIARLLGIGKSQPKATEFVVLVTPELLPNTKVARPAPTIRKSDLVSKSSRSAPTIRESDLVRKSDQPAPTIRKSDLVRKSNRPSLVSKNPLASLWGLVAPKKAPGSSSDD